MSNQPQDAQHPEHNVDVQAEILRLNRVDFPVRPKFRPFAFIYEVTLLTGFMSLAIARISAGSGPADACYGATWDWQLLPFGYYCDLGSLPETGEGAINWSGPPFVFHEVNTPAMVTFLVSTAILWGSVVVRSGMTRIAQRRDVKVETGR